MGCDIHAYVEKRNAKGQWEIVLGKNPWIDEYLELSKSAEENGDLDRANRFKQQVKEYELNKPIVTEGWIYEGRSYNLFGILAGVRNYEVTPISEIKGIPNDSCKKITEEYENWGCDAHSASYYTFEELLDYEWENNTLHNEAWVNEVVYKQFLETGNPYPCAGGVGGGNTEKVTNKEMNRIIRRKYPWEEDKNFYTIIHWDRPYYEYGEYLINNITSYLNEHNNIEPQDIRMVFWFDN